jgi:hypothetical protein
MALGAGLADAQTFRTSLAGEREAPTVGDLDGKGFAAVTFDGTTVRYYLWVKDIESPTQSHIHTGRAGQAGGVLINFAPAFQSVGSNTFVATGSVAVDAATVQAVTGNPAGYYVNVHNGPFSGGAARGQLLGDGPSAIAFASSLRGGREVPGPGDADGDGFGASIIDGTTVYYYLWVRNIATPTAAHIHTGAAGRSGGVLVDFAPTFAGGVASGSVTTSAAVAQAILADPQSYYMNVHNAEFTAGAVRGQLLPTETVAHFPVVARNPGQGTSLFRTDGRLVSIADENAIVHAEWYPTTSGAVTGPAGTATVDLAAGNQAVLDDLVGTLFGANTRGAVRLLSTTPFRAVSRTYNDQRAAGSGTFGQYVEGLGLERAWRAGVVGTGSHRPRTDGTDFRFNLGWFNPTARAANVTFNLRKPDGTLVARQTVSFAGFANEIRAYFDLLTQVPTDQRTLPAFYVTYDSDQPFFLFGSLIDNKTDDPIQEPTLAAPAVITVAIAATPTPTVTPTATPPQGVRLATLQSQIFTPMCSGCHPPNGGMDLRSGQTHASTVNVPSSEQPSLMRVKPGDPDNSYLVRKLAGGPGISGSRMPQGGPFLSAQTLQMVRDWISQGALNN